MLLFSPLHVAFRVLILSSAFIYTASFILQLPTVFDPSRVIIIEEFYFGDTIESVRPEFIAQSKTLNTIAINLAFLVSIQIGLSWSKLADAVSMFLKDDFPKLSKRYFLFVKIIYGGFLILSIFSVSTMRSAPFVVGSNLTMLVIIPVYLIGRMRFLKAIKIVQSDNKGYKRAIFLVSRSSLLTVICTKGIAISWLATGFLFPFSERNTVPGDINVSYLVRNIVHMFALTKLSCDFWYAKQILNNFEKQEQKKQDSAKKIMETRVQAL